MNMRLEGGGAHNHWQQYYQSRQPIAPVSIDLQDFRNLSYRLIIREVERCICAKREEGVEPDIIEIGAGDSITLVDIVRRFALQGEIWGLDYLPEAIKMLEQRARTNGVEIRTVCADLFSPPRELLAKFDMVMSFGVVEHFHDLPGVVKAVSTYASPGGFVFTLIPNNAEGLYGWLMKVFNRRIYDTHVLYTKRDLEEAHKAAGLRVEVCKYLVSSNFGILSWCFADRRRGVRFWIYKQLTRISKLVWFIEDRLGYLKSTPLFAPYILCIAKRLR